MATGKRSTSSSSATVVRSGEAVQMQASWCDGLSTQYEPCSCVEYPGCSEGYPVIACEYQAGHVFAPSSGATIWNFFSQF
jgi:hypothetical protein